MPVWQLLAVSFLLLAPAISFAFDLDAEKNTGDEANVEIVKFYGLVKIDPIQQYVTSVGEKILAQIKDNPFTFKFQVLDTDEINAFAVPGGYVYITRGIMANMNSESALAGVVGHEIGHVLAHHSSRLQKQQLGSMLLTFGALAASKDLRNNPAAWLTASTTISGQIILGFGREFERESDDLGLLYAWEAGYNPKGLAEFLRSLRFKESMSGFAYHGFAATHPDTVERIITTEGKADILASRETNSAKLVIGRNVYLEHINGLPYGKKTPATDMKPPEKIVIRTVKPGDTFERLSIEIFNDNSRAHEMAVINGMVRDDTPPVGEKIKVIVPVDPVAEKNKPSGHGSDTGKDGGPELDSEGRVKVSGEKEKL